MLPTQFLANLGKTRGRGDGGRNLGSRALTLPESANGQRATMQPPQGLDATHGGKLFLVSECDSRQRELCWALIVSALTRWGCAAPSPRCCQPSFSQTWEKPGAEGTGVEIWVAGRSPSPKPQTGNAQQRRRRNGLMRHTAASCFPSMRAA